MGSHLDHESINSLGYILSTRVAQHPEKVAVEQGDEVLTYGGLHVRAKALAHRLVGRGIQLEDPIAILATQGINQIVAQVATVYAHGTCVPLDVYSADADIQKCLGILGAKHFITDAQNANRELNVDGLAVLRVDDGDKDRQREDAAAFDESRIITPYDYRSHILFTSGTTGTPKGVQLLGRGLVRLTRDELCFPPDVMRETRFCHSNNSAFDLAIMDTWGVFLHGATCVVVAKEVLLDPRRFVEVVREKHITMAVMTNSLFTILVTGDPTAFSTLHTVMIGGESPNLYACRAVLEGEGPPKRLLNVYGPTECSVLATGHKITIEDINAGYIPIGMPLYETEAVVLGPDLHPVISQEHGELYLGGPGVSRGYLNNLEKTQQVFVNLPVSHKLRSSNLEGHWYRTGDIVYRDTQGRLVWQGRQDREVKISGHRVHLDVVETELLQTGIVDSVVSMKVQLPGLSIPFLVACVIYTDGYDSLAGAHSKLVAAARTRLPKYMVPQIIAFHKFPIRSNGKLNHQQILDEVIKILDLRRTKADDSQSDGPAQGDSDDDSGLTPTEAKLKRIWAQVLLTVPSWEITKDSNFFLLGGTSLTMALLLRSVQDTFGIPLPAGVLYEGPQLGTVAQYITKNLHSDHETMTRDDLLERLCYDAQMLGKDIPLPTQPLVDWRKPGEGRVLLTGATGHVGVRLLVKFLEDPAVQTVRCLVRASSEKGAWRKLINNLEKYRLQGVLVEPATKNKIAVLAGDIACPRLGLTEEGFAELAEWTSVIYHVAALVDYNQPYTSHVPANVSGTLQLVKLSGAGSRTKPLHYTSSIASFGPSGLGRKGGYILENEAVLPYLQQVIFETGYSQSQSVVECIMHRLMDRGFPIAMYRLGTVACDSTTGIGNPEDFFSRLVKDCVKLGLSPSMPNQRKELLPVDYAVPAMYTISLSNTNLGTTFNITPDTETNIDVNDLFALVARIVGKPIRQVPYWDWVASVKEADHQGVALRLSPVIPMLEERVRGDQARWELWEDMLRFGKENTHAALRASNGGELPDLPGFDEECVRNYLSFLCAV